jgi:hypothetical protein
MTNQPLLDILAEAAQARDALERVQQQVGNLDDIYETEYIDNRRTVGAYQHLTNAIAMVELYMFTVTEELE